MPESQRGPCQAALESGNLCGVEWSTCWYGAARKGIHFCSLHRSAWQAFVAAKRNGAAAAAEAEEETVLHEVDYLLGTRYCEPSRMKAKQRRNKVEKKLALARRLGVADGEVLGRSVYGEGGRTIAIVEEEERAPQTRWDAFTQFTENLDSHAFFDRQEGPRSGERVKAPATKNADAAAAPSWPKDPAAAPGPKKRQESEALHVLATEHWGCFSAVLSSDFDKPGEDFLACVPARQTASNPCLQRALKQGFHFGSSSSDSIGINNGFFFVRSGCWEVSNSNLGV